MITHMKKWTGRFPDLGQVVARFPVSVILMAIFSFILIFISNSFRVEDPLSRLLLGLIIAAYTAFCITIASERKVIEGARTGKPNWIAHMGRALMLQCIAAALICLLAYHSEGLRLNIVMALGAALLLLGNMATGAQIGSGDESGSDQAQGRNLHSWDFTHKIWTGALFATLGSIIFFLGLMAIQETLRSLFGLNLRSFIQDVILPIGFGFLAPLFWLSTVPKVDEDYSELYDNPSFVSKSVAFLGTWLLAPLTLIYALILLAYGVKIILAGSLPDGEIASMTLPFLVIGTLTWLLLLPPFINQKALAKLFRRLWFPVSLPAAALLAVSVGVRISEYGLTQQRAALVFGIIWAIGVGLWFTFGAKNKRDIRLITGSAAALLLLGTVFADRSSLSSQSNRFEAGLKQSGVISSEGKIIGSSAKITDMDAARKAKGALNYLRSHNGVARAEKILAKYDFTLKSDGKLSDQLSELGLADVETAYRGNVYVSYRHEGAVDVSGFDKIYEQSYFTLDSKRHAKFLTEGLYTVEQHNESLRVLRSGEVVTRINLKQWAQGLTIVGNNVILDTPYLTILDQDGVMVKCVFKRISINQSGGQSDYKSNGNIQIQFLTKGLSGLSSEDAP